MDANHYDFRATISLHLLMCTLSGLGLCGKKICYELQLYAASSVSNRMPIKTTSHSKIFLSQIY